MDIWDWVVTALIPSIKLFSGSSKNETTSPSSDDFPEQCPSACNPSLPGPNETPLKTFKSTSLTKPTSSRSRRSSKISNPERCDGFRIYQFPKMREPRVPPSFNIVSVKKALPYTVNKFRREYPMHRSHKDLLAKERLSRGTVRSSSAHGHTKLLSTKHWTQKRSLSVDMNVPATRMYHDSTSRTTWEENEHLKTQIEDPEIQEEENKEEEDVEESACLETSAVFDEEEKELMSERDAFLAASEQAEEDFLNMISGHKPLPPRIPPETFDPWVIKTEAEKHPLTQKSIIEHWKAKREHEFTDVIRSPLKKPKPINALNQAPPFSPKKSSSLPKLENKDRSRTFVCKPNKESVVKVKLNLDNFQDEDMTNSCSDFLSILSQNSEKHNYLVNKIKYMNQSYHNRMHSDENIVFSTKPPYISLDTSGN